MNELNTIPANNVCFRDFLFKNKRNRTILLIALTAVSIQFLVFKYLYPYASYIHGDSFSYIKAADQNLIINTYLIGYSRFLRLFSVFAKSDLALASFQYFLIQSSVLYLLFTLFYFYRISRAAQVVILCFMVCNPLFLHLANLVSSDGYFLALSMIWVTLLLWILNKPSNQIIFWHLIILFLAFITRYNSMLYPVISTGILIMSKLPVRHKLVGIGSGVILCGSFILYTSYKYKTLAGHWQYSPFSGWQWANNAMYAYRYVDSADREPVKNKFSPLDKMVTRYFDKTRDINKYPTEGIMASTYYMWSKSMPLMKYRDSLFKNDTVTKELKKWAYMGPLYKDYGVYIIKKYPWHYVKYFLWPNAMKYYAPPIEFLEFYNSGKDSVPQLVQYWFGYHNRALYTRMESKKVWILNFYPILSGVINVVMVCLLICYVILKGWQFNKRFNKIVYLFSAIWILNAGFTIFASPAALRFQSFPIILTTIIVTLFIDWMIELIMGLNKKSMNLIGEEQVFNNRLPSQITA